MNAKDLKTIYNNAILSDYPNDSDLYYNYFDGLKYLIFLKDDLSNQELLLLQSLTKDISSKSKWYDYLVRGLETINIKRDSAQCIHFHVKNINNNKIPWLNSFKSYFNNIYDAFFVDDENGVVIVNKYQGENKHLQGFTYMLDDDFSTSTSIYIGISQQISNLNKVYIEEKSLFLNNLKSGKIISFEEVFIPEYIAPQLNNSFISQQIKASIINDDELVNLIKTLWENQGNQTATAEQLFIHRNTLNYRIDKLLKRHDLNLRDMQQLLLCYLLIV